MTDSILNSVKKILGIDEAYHVYDFDIMTHINSALNTLTQVGIGPVEGYAIDSDSDTWVTFLGSNPKYNAAKTYVFLKVRMIFDPPQTAHLVAAQERQLEEMLTRLNYDRESTDWVNPLVKRPERPIVLDGGTP